MVARSRQPLLLWQVRRAGGLLQQQRMRCERHARQGMTIRVAPPAVGPGIWHANLHEPIYSSILELNTGRRAAGNAAAARALLERFSDRPALHALTLGFTHPSTGERLQFSSQLPPDMEQLLEDLRALGSSQ